MAIAEHRAHVAGAATSTALARQIRIDAVFRGEVLKSRPRALHRPEGPSAMLCARISCGVSRKGCVRMGDKASFMGRDAVGRRRVHPRMKPAIRRSCRDIRRDQVVRCGQGLWLHPAGQRRHRRHAPPRDLPAARRLPDRARGRARRLPGQAGRSRHAGVPRHLDGQFDGHASAQKCRSSAPTSR